MCDRDTFLLQMFQHSYFMREVHRDFAVEDRASLVYALPYLQVQLSKVNAKGPDPVDYLEFAKADLLEGSDRGNINAVGNAKRSVHSSIEGVGRLLRLDRELNRKNFPTKLRVLRSYGVFPTRMIESLNRRRNYLEHEYETVSQDQAADLVEIAELFVQLAYVYFTGTIIGAYVGVVGDSSCYEFCLEPSSGNPACARVKGAKSVALGMGSIHYNVRSDATRTPHQPEFIKRAGSRAQAIIMDLLIYCTRKRPFRLMCGGEPGEQLISASNLKLPILEDEDLQEDRVVKCSGPKGS